MKLRIFSVVGEALNFGLRRMETIMRVAWLPVVLILILDMATLFSVLSVAAGQLITFSDVVSYVQAQNALSLYSARAWAANAGLVAMILAASFGLQAVLASSFLAPLIRFAGLGERPSPGVVNLAFGADQLRFLLALIAGVLVVGVFVFLPAGAAAYYILNYIGEAMTQTYASFPNPDSLHTVELLSGRDVLAARGEIWLYNQAIPLAAAIGLALVLWILLTMHLAPSNRLGGAGAPNLLARAAATFAGGGAVVGLVWALLLNAGGLAAGGDLANFYWFAAILIVLACYVSLRAAPYQGVVACRRSMAPAGTLRVTRGWNIARLAAITLLMGAIIYAVVFVVNNGVFTLVASVNVFLYLATESTTRVINDGEPAGWALPVFIWIWNGFKILVNIFLAFFEYGVFAGLLGRLYRESERTD